MRRSGYHAAAQAPARIRFSNAERGNKDVRNRTSSLHPLLQRDLELVTWFVRLRQKHAWLSWLVRMTTSRRRTHDMTLALWLVFLLALPALGFPYLWICVINVLSVLLLQHLAQIKRPIDIDSSLFERARVDPDTHGFPCVDSHMAVVVLLPAALYTESLALQLLAMLLALGIGLAKLFVAARFVSQVVGSHLTGVAGVLAGTHGHAIVEAHRLARGYNTAAIVVLVVFLLFVVGTWVENNDSNVLGVPKQDYLDVLGNILGSDAPVIPTKTTTASQAATVHQLPAASLRRRQQLDSDVSDSSHSDPQQHYANNNGSNDEHDDDEEQTIIGKHDSFYYLMQGMRARARQRDVLSL